jgi:anti-sigma regulatory factor (Ser/Thr protein kinase)
MGRQAEATLGQRVAERKTARSEALNQEASSMSRILALPYDSESPAAARRLVRQFAVERTLNAGTGVQCLIVSELVANAVVHGAPPVELTLRYEDDEVTIEVADGDPTVERVRQGEPSRSRPDGRGLQIVASLAKRWGVRPFSSGKIVWATTHP